MAKHDELFRVVGVALDALETIRRITGRDESLQVMTDALRVYEWVLAEQFRGRVIVSQNPSRDQGQVDADEVENELENFIKDREAAQRYYDADLEPHATT